MWMLGTEPKSSATAASAVNWWAISPAPWVTSNWLILCVMIAIVAYETAGHLDQDMPASTGNAWVTVPFTVCGCEWSGELRSGLWTQHTTVHSPVSAGPLCSAPCTVSSLQQFGMSWSQCGLKRDLFLRTFMEMTISSVALKEWVHAAFHSFPFRHLSGLFLVVIYQFAYRLLKLFYCCGPSGTQTACL